MDDEVGLDRHICRLELKSALVYLVIYYLYGFERIFNYLYFITLRHNLNAPLNLFNLNALLLQFVQEYLQILFLIWVRDLQKTMVSF